LVAVHATPRGSGDLWFDEILLETHLTAEPAALALLAEEVEPWHHKYPDVAVKRAVFVGHPLKALLRASNGADLLIVGRSRQGRDRRLLGSVAHGAIDRATCPLAVVAGDFTTEEAGP
jgi:nucleotide-binding universal stress UspA family protein